MAKKAAARNRSGNESATAGLLAALSGVGEETLAEVTQQIVSLEIELDGLRELKKLIETRLHGKPLTRGRIVKMNKRQSSALAATSEGNGQPTNGAMTDDCSPVCRQRRVDLRTFLKTSGAQSQSRIAQSLDIPVGSMAKVIDCDWFERRGGLVALSEAGMKGDT